MQRATAPVTGLLRPLLAGVCSVRHGLALLLHLCNFAISTQLMNLSIALPAMVNGTAPAGPPNASSAVALDDGNGALMEPKVLVCLMRLGPFCGLNGLS